MPSPMKSPSRIKLIRPPVLMSFPANTRLPYGMGVIAAALRQNGYEVHQDDLFARGKKFNSKLGFFSNSIINMGILSSNERAQSCLVNGVSDSKLNRLTEKLLRLTSYKDYDIIGFSLLSFSEFLFALLLAEKIKRETGATIVLGGAFITVHADLYFERYPFIDYMIAGDGSVPLLKLMDYFEGNGKTEDVPNLYYRENGEVRVTPRKDFDIEDIPLPDFQGLPMESYKEEWFEGKLFLPYQISRGCTGKCSFCSFRKVDARPAIKSPHKVLRELEEYSEEYKSPYFSMCDTSFNAFHQEIEEICEGLIKRRLDIKWEALVKVDNMDKRLLSKMRRAGCSFLKIGIESGSDRILSSMNKGCTAEQASRVFKAAHELGMNTRSYFIVGYPHESQEDIHATIRFIKENKTYINSFSFFKFHLDYGSSIYCNPEEFGVENLRERTNFFEFDEINGLSYREKQRQQTKAFRYVLKTLYREVLSERFGIFFFAFRLFMRFERISQGLLFRLLPQRILDMLYLLEPRYFGGSLGGGFGVYIAEGLFPFQPIRNTGLRPPIIFRRWAENRKRGNRRRGG